MDNTAEWIAVLVYVIGIPLTAAITAARLIETGEKKNDIRAAMISFSLFWPIVAAFTAIWVLAGFLMNFVESKMDK